MILKSIPLKEYQPGVHQLPEATYDLKPGQLVTLTYNGKGEIIALFEKDLMEGSPKLGMGMVLQATKRFKGVQLATKMVDWVAEEIWIVEDNTAKIQWDGVEISGTPKIYPREEGETKTEPFQRSFLDDAMDDALKGSKDERG